MELEKVIKELQQWQRETFEKESLQGIINHLKSEVEELDSELLSFNEFNSKEKASEELIDILSLSFCIAKKLELSTKDLSEIMSKKLEINKKRTWEFKNGFYQHVK